MGAKKKKAGDATKGEKVFKNLCAVCHGFTGHGQGPNLKGVVGRPTASMEGWSYSAALQGMSDKKWTEGNIDKYLKSPADYAPGNAMAFAGLANAKDRSDVIAYLKTQS